MTDHPEAGIDYRRTTSPEDTERTMLDWLNRSERILEARLGKIDKSAVVDFACAMALRHELAEIGSILEWELEKIAHSVEFTG